MNSNSQILVRVVVVACVLMPIFGLFPNAEEAAAHALPCGSSTPIGPNNCWESKAWAGGNTGALTVFGASGRDLATSRPTSEFIKAGIWVSNGASGGQDCTGQAFGYCWIELQLRKRSQQPDAWFWADKRSSSNFFEHFIANAGPEAYQPTALVIQRRNSTTWDWFLDFGDDMSPELYGASTSNNLVADHIEIGMQVKSTANHSEIVVAPPLLNQWIYNSYRVGSGDYDYQFRDADFSRNCTCINSTWVPNSPNNPGGYFEAYVNWT